MLNTKLLLSIVISLIVSVSFAQKQEFYTVTAHSGLSLRKEPSLKADKITLLSFNKEVHLVERTNIALKVTDKGVLLSGYWAKVETLDGYKGYVFDAYLFKRNSTTENLYLCEGDNTRCKTKITSKNFDLVIYNYLLEGSDIEQKIDHDTLAVYEYVFNSLGDKLIEIFPNTPTDSVAIYHTLYESINELPPNHNVGDEWYANRVVWEGQEEMKRIARKGYLFRIPDTDYEGQENYRLQKMELRDTLVILESEFSRRATLVYKNKPCTYLINKIILKIVLFNNGKEIDVKYLDVTLSYGC
ncbi:MAG: SH3 domain-containing protein [Bacteroidales bacterium]|nr:SH3 domain-containing protein [Bacteroidales bacterium]